jgi:hypothetical protein
MSAVIREPEKPNEDGQEEAVTLRNFALSLQDHETDSRQKRISWFANGVFILVLAAAFVAVGLILSPTFTGF